MPMPETLEQMVGGGEENREQWSGELGLKLIWLSVIGGSTFMVLNCCMPRIIKDNTNVKVLNPERNQKYPPLFIA